MGSVRRHMGILAVSGIGLSSCLLTSSFDGLTSDTRSGSSGGGGSDASSGQGGDQGGSGAGANGGGAATSTSAGGGGGTISFPTTRFLDRFNQPDGTPSAAWLFSNPGAWYVASNTLESQGDPGAAIWSRPFGPTQEVFLTLSSFSEADLEIELLLKNKTVVDECECINVTYNVFDGPRQLFVTTCNDGNFTGWGPPFPVVFSPGDQFGARTYPDGKLDIYLNGSIILTRNLSGWSGASEGGRIGVFAYGISGELRIDDFGGG
jgi:hypothetical protein